MAAMGTQGLDPGTGRLFARRFQILPNIPASGAVQHSVAEMPKRVATIIDREAFDRSRALVHQKTVFLEDRLHDWEWRAGQFRYYSRVAEAADVVLVFDFEPQDYIGVDDLVWFLKSMRMCRVVDIDTDGFYTVEVLDSGKRLHAPRKGICLLNDRLALKGL